MQSPFLIGLLSIIPGLGFFVLGKPRRGLGVLGILFVLLFLFLFVPGEFITQASLQLAIVVYLGQIYMAAQSAKILKRELSGEITAPREKSKIEPAPGLSLQERGDYKLRETVRQQLNPGEQLHEAVVAQSGNFVGTYALFGAVGALSLRQYYLGLTEDTLVMIEQDNFGKSIDIKRLPLADIRSCKYNKKILYDDLVLDLGENNTLKLTITAGLRRLTKPMVEKLQSLIAS